MVRRRSRHRLEHVAEAGLQIGEGHRVGVGRDAVAGAPVQRPQIVDAVGVVGVDVGEQHGVDRLDLGIQKLLAQIRRGVDQNPPAGLLDENGAAPPPVARPSPGRPTQPR